ncbi:MAG: phosphatidylglycerophosphatase A [Bilophila wadsworthia]
MDKLILAFCRLGFGAVSYHAGDMRFRVGGSSGSVSVHPLPFVARIVVLVLVFWIGGMAATRGEQILGTRIRVRSLSTNCSGMAGPVAVFQSWLGENRHCLRLIPYFRHVKPWPVHASSWLPGGYASIDDVMAGLQALLVMWLLQLVGFGVSEQCDAPSGNGIFSQSLCWKASKGEGGNFPYGGIWRKHF